MKNLDGIDPDWSLLEWDKYIYVPLGVKVAIPNMARGCPFTCSFCCQWKFWRDYRVRDPKKVADEIENLVDKHDVGFFILADEEPTINRKKFIAFCQELIDRGLNKKVKWGINTRVTDIYRDRELLKFYREAGLVHVSLGTEAAAQLKLDQFNKETKVSENKEAIRLLREADIFVEAQFIVGLDNETPETLEETYRMAWDWQPDLANWAMYTPWPFTPLFQELGDKVEIPTLRGKALMSVPSGTQSGKVFRLRGQGLPRMEGSGKGDQLVRVFCEIPSKLTDRQKELLEEFQEIDGEKHGRRSFFERVTEYFQ